MSRCCCVLYVRLLSISGGWNVGVVQLLSVFLCSLLQSSADVNMNDSG